MPRPPEFPDPRARSIYEPTVILSNTKVIALFNQEKPKEKAKYVSDNVRNWVHTKAKILGWGEVDWHGNQAVLKAHLTLKEPENL